MKSKPGGRLVVIAETYRGGSRDAVVGAAMRLFGSPSHGVKEHRELFVQAGYSDVEVFEERKKGWICVTGKEPGLQTSVPFAQPNFSLTDISQDEVP